LHSGFSFNFYEFILSFLKFHGSGSYSFGNGNTIKCKWSKGIISGECTFTRAQVQQCNEDKTAYSYTGTYKDGKIIAVGRPAVYIRSIPTGEIDLL